MTKVSYSTVFEQTADQVWAVIRDFNSYPVWVESVTESHIEDGKSGDAIGAIRNFVEYGTSIRQRLVAHSDLDRFYTDKSQQGLGFINPPAERRDDDGNLMRKIAYAQDPDGNWLEFIEDF